MHCWQTNARSGINSASPSRLFFPFAMVAWLAVAFAVSPLSFAGSAALPALSSAADLTSGIAPCLFDVVQMGQGPRNLNLARTLLTSAPLYGHVENLRFSAPLPLIKRYLLQEYFEKFLPAVPEPLLVIPARWSARLDPAENGARVHLEISVSVFNASPFAPAVISLFPQDVVFEDLRLNGQTYSPLLMDGWFQARVTTSGLHVLTAALSISGTHESGHSSIKLAKSAFAVSVISINTTQTLDVRVAGAPGRIVGAADRGTSGVLAVGAEPEITVSWGPPIPDAQQEGTVSLQSSAAWTVAEKTLSANMILDARIVGGSTEKINLTLPAGADNVRIQGPDVRDSRVSGSSVEVFLRGRIQGGTALTLSFVMPRPAGDEVALPEIGVGNGRIVEGGWTLVSNDAGGELLERDATGLTPMTSLDVPPRFLGLSQQTPLYLYQRDSRSPRAVFDLVMTTPFPVADTIADRATIECVVRASGEEITRIAYSMRNNRRQFLRM
ncbi:MAG: hypothetical protein NTX50_24180, partial [Candidatus Sumerlaeota bacterium]|nr:hypothetical protein [Candidatus Sumerlaeota bacterium]